MQNYSNSLNDTVSSLNRIPNCGYIPFCGICTILALIINVFKFVLMLSHSTKSRVNLNDNYSDFYNFTIFY